jgi:serine/threonine protein kinase
MRDLIGRTLGHYRIVEMIGGGGMGEVFRAQDTHLDRDVAIKVLRPEAVRSPEFKRRFVLEAKAASALNHPNILTVHDIDQVTFEGEGIDFIAMEFVDGKPLDNLIADRRLPLEETLNYAIQTAGALAAAHAVGIVHRDIKPENIMVTGAGHLKVLDFGLAKLVASDAVDELAPTRLLANRTEKGVILGTAPYMSPEQAEGKAVDARSDVFSFGTVLYEMLAGRRPFEGDSHASMCAAILRHRPAPLKTVRPDVPSELQRIVSRCLEKDRESRYPSAAEIFEDLKVCQSRSFSTGPDLKAVLLAPRFAIPLLAILIVVVGTGAFLWVENSRSTWARTTALPEIARLTEQNNYVAAFELALRAEPFLHDDPQFQRLQSLIWVPVSIQTEPSGADIFIKGYSDIDAEWQQIGTTPLENIAIPGGNLRWRISKEGYETKEAVLSGWFILAFQFTLELEGAAPLGMVRVPSGSFRVLDEEVQLAGYWIDRYEVTNRAFQEFVDAGGYENRRLWKEPFYRNGQEIPWEQALSGFRDETGRPGPATWELGTFPEGKADFPVGGVSWYEAAAYAEFAGKSLPTVYHWFRAAGLGIFSDILQFSNFGGKGPMRTGSNQGLGPYGTLDMAGNVKEWCWNLSGRYRYLLGGAWSDPPYIYGVEERQMPFDRSSTNGFRCAKYAPPPIESLAPIETLYRDYSQEQPVDDDVFQIAANLYSYDRTELNAMIKSVDDRSEHWRMETITFDAAYGDERVMVHLALPRNSAPPYQVAIFCPGVNALRLSSSQALWELEHFDFLPRSGRAFLFPIYKYTYERGGGETRSWGPSAIRDQVVCWSKDLRRSVDYLETRDDIDHDRLAFYGLSLGAIDGPVMTALEPRLKASVLLGGGLTSIPRPAEIDPMNFAPRVTVPTLMINGRYDTRLPLEISQKPLFRLLGVPENEKRHAVLEAGHFPPKNEIIKESLDWLDRYLGPVNLKR